MRLELKLDVEKVVLEGRRKGGCVWCGCLKGGELRNYVAVESEGNEDGIKEWIARRDGEG